MEQKVINTCYGKCRFCNKMGNHREIMKEYYWEGVREVYFHIIQECFNLYIQANSNKSSLICSYCVQRLRDASTFRMMVVNADIQLNDVLDKQTVFVNTGLTNPQPEVKNEGIKQENIGHLNENNDSLDISEDILEKISFSEDFVNGELELLSRFHQIKPLPSRTSLKNICKKYYRELELLKGKTITAKSLKKLITGPNTQKSISKTYITEKLAHIVNVTTILKHSNLTAFKTKRRSGFPCFYCSQMFENVNNLTDHQNMDHCKDNIKRIIDKYPSESLVVYVHVTEIKCLICGQVVTNINNLKQHLIRIHNKKLYTNYGDRVIPFKLNANEYECQICGFNFETFGSIERHMNVHYRNYVCDQCGAGYVTKNRLKVHIKSIHVRGIYPCDICKKIFNTQYKFKNHVDVVHKMIKKNKCPKCPERFTDYFDRHKHMVDVHGETPLRYKCNVCDMLFKRRYALSCHMKRRHLEVRDIQCNVCPYKCYTATELKAHMIKHNGERTYECMVCKKSYARKKTLKEHMRIHNNDRRFVCVVCGQAFVQNCSLKGHMKTHHIDYLNNLPR